LIFRALAPPANPLARVMGEPVSETEMRAAIVAEARSWLGTPYHHQARVRGVGVDCAMLLAEVYEKAGAIPHLPTPEYPADWMLHRSAERYIGFVLEHAREITGPPQGPTPLPGDIVLWRVGRCFAHGAIVTEWPLVIHAFVRQPVQEIDAERRGPLSFDGGKPRPRRFFRLSCFQPCSQPPLQPCEHGWVGGAAAVRAGN